MNAGPLAQQLLPFPLDMLSGCERQCVLNEVSIGTWRLGLTLLLGAL